MLRNTSPRTKALLTRNIISRRFISGGHAQNQELKTKGLFTPMAMVSILSLGTLGLMKATLATNYKQPDFSEGP
ncbi:hypothetical protein K7432_000472 [Basidiobolus ranarum]|uniref:Uncharacterized protein n=1 Tax=Basidiobolus ranarum TaxID=34480 RepID=A0ABR2WB35_9FUNG